MEIVVILFLVVCGIGALIVGAAGLVAFIAYWWVFIPIICALVGGWIGFFFGIGLDVVIGFFVLIAKSGDDWGGTASPSKSPTSDPALQITHIKYGPLVSGNIETRSESSFVLCPKCNERNNPTFFKCWKCGASL